MESLVANYASSDEEGEERPPPGNSRPFSSLSLPPPNLSSSNPISSPSMASLAAPKNSSLISSSSSLLGSDESRAGAVGGIGGRGANPFVESASFGPSKAATKALSSLFSSLPPPKAPYLLKSALPLPKSNEAKTNFAEEIRDRGAKPVKDSASLGPSKRSSSLFSALPTPKASKSTSLDPTPKRVVQFAPPLNPYAHGSYDSDEDEEEEKERKRIKESASSNQSKALSSMLPAPRHSLGLGSRTSSAASRLSLVEDDVPVHNAVDAAPMQEAAVLENYGNYDDGWVTSSAEARVEGGLESDYVGNGEASYSTLSYGSNEGSGWPASYGGNEASDYASTYGGSEQYESHVGNWSAGSAAVTAPEIPEMGRIGGKRGRNEIPTEIVEVTQDELMKNRPREDKAKLTGIAFGPSYQPVSSGKGKPSKLHKKKHQIGSLYFDMKQKEQELAERRAKGFLTKAETHAKYGW